MSAEDEVRRASDQFYAALNRMANGDPGPMSEVWSHGPDVTTMHPIGGRQVGWDEVRASWEQVSKIASAGQISFRDQLLHVVGDVAYELGTEHVMMTLAGHPVRAENRVTNVYRREGGTWKMVHHHTDISPQMLEVLSRLQPPSG